MKLITAIIREESLDQVRQALIDAEIYRITVSRCSGRGAQVIEEVYRGAKVIPHLVPKVRLDIAVNEEFVSVTCDAILNAAVDAGEPQLGSGKIFITDLQECIRIRTKERGGKAI